MTPGKARFAAVVFVWIAVEAGACDDHIFSEGFEPIDLLFNAQVYVDQYAGNVAVVWERTPGPVHISLWNISDDCEQASATQIGGYNLGFGQFHFSGDEGDTFEFRLIPNGNSVRFTYGAVNVALLTIDE